MQPNGLVATGGVAQVQQQFTWSVRGGALSITYFYSGYAERYSLQYDAERRVLRVTGDSPSFGDSGRALWTLCARVGCLGQLPYGPPV